MMMEEKEERIAGKLSLSGQEGRYLMHKQRSWLYVGRWVVTGTKAKGGANAFK